MYELFDSNTLDTLVSKDYNFSIISPQLLCEKLSADQLQEIINIYYSYKKEYTKLFVEIFKEPNSYIDIDNPERNLKEKFIQEINDNAGQYV